MRSALIIKLNCNVINQGYSLGDHANKAVANFTALYQLSG